jgi:hypothetical protein
MANGGDPPVSPEHQQPAAAEDERLTEEAAAVLNQLRAYLRETLDERSFTALLADLTHLRIRLERVRSTPDHVARALRALDAGLKQALSELHRRDEPPA